MDETNVTAPGPDSPGKWIAKVIAAVLLAEAVWSFIVSATNNLILPALARVMVEDAQSPLYLGKGEFNVPAIFSLILEACVAGIVAAVLYQWSRSAPRVRVRTVTVKTVPVAAKSEMPSTLPSAPPPPVGARPPAPVAPQPSPAPVAASIAVPAPSPVPSAQTKPTAPLPKPAPAARPSKPQKPAEVYYNIVGEPINPTEND